MIRRRGFLLGSASIMPASCLATATSAQDAAPPAYRFVHMLWSMSDPIAQLHVKAGEAYLKSHPNVTIDYVGPEAYDPAQHAQFLDTILNSRPDGVALHISNPDALGPSLQAARAAGVPVVSVTSHPPTPEDEAKLTGLYLTWVGADENLIGVRMGERLLQDVPEPKHVAYMMSHLGHAGHEMRASGFFSAMPAGTTTDKVATGDEPTAAMDIIRSFISSNPDVTAIFGGAPSNKWMTDVVAQLGRTDIKVLTSDEAPSSIEGVLNGLIFASFSQAFPIQAPLAYEVLYNYKHTGMAPIAPIVTGPQIIDASNAQAYKNLVLGSLGEDSYFELSPY